MSRSLDMGYAFPNGRARYTASWWTLLKAKLFGKKYVSRSGRYTLIAYYWRGIYYVTRYDAL